MTGALGIDGNRVENGIRHLGGEEPAPDELIELILIGGQALPHPLRLQLHMGGADGFVGILSAGLGFEYMVAAVVVVLAVAGTDKVGGCVHGFVGKPQRIGTHIGDEARGALAGDFHAFIELLGHHHGLLGGEAQLPGGLLLQGGGGKGRGGGTLLFRLLHVGDGKLLPGDIGDDSVCLFLIFQLPLFGTAVVVSHKGAGLAHPVEGYVQGPVLFRLEGPDLVLPVHNQSGGHGLNTARGQTPPHLLPQQRGQFVANDSVQNPACLLGIHQTIVNISGMLDRILHYLFRNFIKGHPLGLVVGQIQKLLQVPGNGFALPVRVGCEVDGVSLGGIGLEFFNERLLAPDGDILGSEIMLDVHAHFALGQVPQVAHAGLDGVAGAKILPDGLCLGGRLHDHKIVRLTHILIILRFIALSIFAFQADA